MQNPELCVFTDRSDDKFSLARGRGLLDGGVEIECFTDDTNALKGGGGGGGGTPSAPPLMTSFHLLVGGAC